MQIGRVLLQKHTFLEYSRLLLGLLPELKKVVNDAAEVDGHVDVEGLEQLDTVGGNLLDLAKLDGHAESLDCRLPVALLLVEVVDGQLSVKRALGLLLLILATRQLERDIFALEQEHGHKVALVLVNEHNVGAFRHLELNGDLIRDTDGLFLDLDLLLSLGLRVFGGVVCPHFSDLREFFCHFVCQRLDHVDVVEGDLGLKWR